MNMQQIKKNGVDKLVLDFDFISHLLFSGASGKSCKSTAINRVEYESWRKGATIIIIANSKNNVEAGSRIFPITAKWQIEKLKIQEENPIIPKMIFYHSYTNNFPTRKLYPYQIGTYSIKDCLSRSPIGFLFESAEETSSLSILNNALDSLRDDDSLFDLLEKVKGKGTSININVINNYLSKLKTNPIFFPHSSKTNFNFEKILKNNQTMHLFDNRFHSDPKIKILNNLIVLEAIKKVKEEGRSKYPVIIVMDELKSFVPSQVQFAYQSILAKILADLISTLRSLGVMFVSATQSIFDIDNKVQQSFTDIIQGRIGGAFRELKDLSNILGLDVQTRQELMALPKNNFILLNQMRYGVPEVYQFHAPPWNLFTAGEHFDRMCEKFYPDKLKSHKENLDSLKKQWKDQEITSKGRTY